MTYLHKFRHSMPLHYVELLNWSMSQPCCIKTVIDYDYDRHYYFDSHHHYHHFWAFSSHSYTIKSGNPQGSILGPSLFSDIINDICDYSVRNSSFLLFADAEMLRTVTCCSPTLTLFKSGASTTA